MNDATTALTKTNISAVPLKRGARRARVAAGVALALPLLCGCQVLTYVGSQGERFSRTSFGAVTAISALIVESGSNGLRRVEMRGYRQDSTQALGVVTEAAVRAAIQGVK